MLLDARERAAYDDEARIDAFREFVCRLRTVAGLSKGEFADRLEVGPDTVARMEDGETGPDG